MKIKLNEYTSSGGNDLLDLTKIGEYFYKIRKAKKLSQKEIAQMLNVSYQTVSKWERGAAVPDNASIKSFIKEMGMSVETFVELIKDESPDNNQNLTQISFYICPTCNGITWSTGNCQPACCGKRLQPLKVHKSDKNHFLHVEYVDKDYFITSSHEMTQEHYISFLAYVRHDKVLIVRLRPGQDMQSRIPSLRRGRLYFYCTKHGLFENIE